MLKKDTGKIPQHSPVSTPSRNRTGDRPVGEPSANDKRYKLTRLRTLAHHFLGLLPPAWRERLAERFLRRAGAPGPATEHVVQYLLSTVRPPTHSELKQAAATVAKGADHFYERQYRQCLNATMGAFAMTATQALVASSGLPQGHLWRRHRRTYSALLEQTADAAPILVLDHQAVAVPLLLPRPKRKGERELADHWLAGRRSMPAYYRGIVTGEKIPAHDTNICARLRSADGALLEVADAALKSKRLALLALHPHDPDAMGLHITLFGTEMLEAERIEQDYGLDSAALDAYRHAAERTDRTLMFCVGGTEEVFTQCSQNIFVKRPLAGFGQPGRPTPIQEWTPALPLERLLDHQFEAIQVTVSASGLPGASPRNGDLGKACFVGRRGRRIFVLVPYHPGNAIHGHAAKLWSNPYGTLVISDDHHTLSRVMVSGPSRVIDHRRVKRSFPAIAAQISAQCSHNGKPMPDPEYWFLQEAAELVQQREPLVANTLDPGRPTCSISAGGQAHHGKKPGYFAANTLPTYDQGLQHERERMGRPVDPAGATHRQWLSTVRDALDARHAHLQRALRPPDEETVDLAAHEFGHKPSIAASRDAFKGA